MIQPIVAYFDVICKNGTKARKCIYKKSWSEKQSWFKKYSRGNPMII